MAMRKIVGSFITANQEFQQIQAADASAAAKKVGFDSEIEFADGNPVTQIQQLFKHIHAPDEERPAALVVEPVSGNGYERVARNAVGAGIGWVLVNAEVPYVEKLHSENPGLPISLVTTDQVEIGRIQAQQFKALMPNGGALLYVRGPSNSVAASNRRQGMQEGVTGTDIEVEVISADWTDAGGEIAAESWMQMAKLKGRPIEDSTVALVGSQNDSIAAGVRRVLLKRRPNWTNLLFTGCDGLPDGGQKMVKSGHLSATVVRPANAGIAVSTIARFIDEKTPMPALEILAPESYPPIDQIA